MDNTTYEAVLFGYRDSIAAAGFLLVTALVLASWAISLTWRRMKRALSPVTSRLAQHG